MTDSGKPVNTPNVHSATTSESKSVALSLRQEKIPSWLSAAGHIAVLALQNVEHLPKVLEAIAHLGVQLLDDWAAEDDIANESCDVSDADTDEEDWGLPDA